MYMNLKPNKHKGGVGGETQNFLLERGDKPEKGGGLM